MKKHEYLVPSQIGFSLEKILDLAKSIVCQDKIHRTIEVLCRHDRYQASHGIVAAVQDLAEILRFNEDVTPTLTTLDVDHSGAWDFGMPPSWTPIVASLELPNGEMFSLAQHPLLIATNSKEFARQSLRVMAYEPGKWTGKKGRLALVEPCDFDLGRLVHDGVTVFATRVPFMSDEAGDDARGRLELAAETNLTGFSLDRHQFDALQKLSDQRLNIAATVKIDNSAKLPLLSWEVPGAFPGEIWVMAHICHQKPGANDNASGVAGLVEVTRCCSAFAQQVPAEQRRTIRFFTGPEFTGIAAFLENSIAKSPNFKGPKCVINLDMIGQDTVGNGGVFRVERCPKAAHSNLTAVAEKMVADTFHGDGHEWSAMAFKGYSDNSIFAGGPMSCPTVQFCHDKDIYNHTSEDRADRLSYEKLATVSAAAAATTLVMAMQTDAATEYRKGVFDTWAADQSDRIVRPVPATKPQVRFLNSPLNLRGLLQGVDPRTRQTYFDMLSQNKETYAAVLNTIIYADEGRTTADAIEAAAASLDRRFCDEMIRLLSEIVEQIRTH